MSSCTPLLRFHLPGHASASLRRITRLRSEERFCDVTIVARSLRFRGHRVVLAASSPFLRDQFLLHPGAELRLAPGAHRAAVLADLLLSCYTGDLVIAKAEMLDYLAAASFLQMEHVVERCRGVLAKVVAVPGTKVGYGDGDDDRFMACPVPKLGYGEEDEDDGFIASPLPKPGYGHKDEDDGFIASPLAKLGYGDKDNDDRFITSPLPKPGYGDDDDDSDTDVCIVKVEPAPLRRRGRHHQDTGKPPAPVRGRRRHYGGVTGVVKARYSRDGDGVVIFP
uniref:Uncharacterized protein n=1 Tax=Melopsittacus undulatus TaxID=13146 RepID=A0A8V5GCG5_MELUD